MVSLIFSINQEDLVGNEPDFFVRVEIVVVTGDGNRDSDIRNNLQNIMFSIDFLADISITQL